MYVLSIADSVSFFFQAEDGIRDLVRSRGLGDVYKRQTYKYVDIPLLVGYEMPMGRSSIMLHAGPVFNLTTTHEGQILDPMLHPRYITDGEPGAIDVYKTNLGMSLYFGAGMLFLSLIHI